MTSNDEPGSGFGVGDWQYWQRRAEAAWEREDKAAQDAIKRWSEINKLTEERDALIAEVESLRHQVAEQDGETKRLADAIVAIPGEPASEGSAIDVAIRLIRDLAAGEGIEP